MINNPTVIRSASNPYIAGAVNLVAGTNISFSQTGQSITINSSGGGGGTWGSITGTLSDQTDLQNALDAKESALTFSTGLTRATNTITNNLSTGISGGQTVYGGTGSGDNLVLRSTTNATRGNVKIDTTSGGFNFRDYLGSIPAIYPGSNVTAGSDGFILASFGTTSMFYGAGGASSLYHYVSGGNRTLLSSSLYNISVNTSIGLALGTTPSSKLEVNTNALGVTQTTSSGIALTNKTAAALGAQQISPALRWSGSGWKTATTAASQSVDFRSYVVPVQGAANPTGYLTFESQINGGGYSEVARVTNTGVFTTTADIISGGTVRLKSYTVATLPTTPTQGDTAFVTDATAPTYLGVAVGGGAVVAPVFYDGTNWITH